MASGLDIADVIADEEVVATATAELVGTDTVHDTKIK